MNRKRKRLAGLIALVLVIALPAGHVSYAADGWTQQNGNWYYMDQSGTALKAQMKTINFQKYCFDENGAMLHDVWYYDNSDNKWYYMGSDGTAVKGWANIESEWYYFLTGGTMVADGWRTIDNKKYYFGESGVMKRNGYVGEKYLDSSGMNDSRYDIKVRGKVDKEVLEESGDMTEHIPGWLLDHVFKTGWKIAYNAEKENYGKITHEDYDDFVRYYDLETGRKLIFFVQPEFIIQSIGLYVNYSFGKPGNGEDFQGAFSVDWNNVSDMFDQLPIVERSKDLTFAEVFALYYNENEDVQQEFREYCPSLCEFMDRFMEECRVKALTGA